MLDSLGELANMIGGNLKSMLPAECQSFNGPEGPFNVTLFEIAAQAGNWARWRFPLSTIEAKTSAWGRLPLIL